MNWKVEVERLTSLRAQRDARAQQRHQVRVSSNQIAGQPSGGIRRINNRIGLFTLFPRLLLVGVGDV